MKKYLIKGALALLVGGMMASCADDSEYVPLAQQKVQAFSNLFNSIAKENGGIDPNHTWGFSERSENESLTRASYLTRSEDVGECIKPDMTEYPSSNAPAAITDKEREWVLNWFAEHPGLSEKGLDIADFYVQHVGNNGYEKQGYFHNADGSVEKRTATIGVMDKLHIGSTPHQSETLHILDFNANSTGSQETRFVNGGSALYFGYHTPWGQDVDSPDRDGYYWYFKCVELTVPGECFDDGVERTGWYVGLSFYGLKIETRNADGTPEKWEEYGKQRLDYADDWVLKIVQGNHIDTDNSTGGGGNASGGGSTTTETKTFAYSVPVEWGRVFCEDLGQAASREDLDYNDVVFDAIIWHNYSYTETWVNGALTNTQSHYDNYDAQIYLLAAGGTLPLTVANYEVHNALGNFPVDCMINTRDDQSAAYGYYENNVTPVYLCPPNYTGNPADYRFPYASIKDIPVVVNYNTSQTAVLNADRGAAPHKLLVPFKTLWMSERHELQEGYPVFWNWVSNQNASPWSGTSGNNLYNTASGWGLEVPQTQGGQTGYDSNTVNHPYTIFDQSVSYEDSWTDKTIKLSMDNLTLQAGKQIRINGSTSNYDSSWMTVDINGNGYPYNNKFSSGITITLTQDMANALNANKSMRINGQYFTLTSIEYIP